MSREEFLAPGEAARVFGVHPKTISRWAKTGKLPFVTTLGGHRRYRVADIRRALFQGGSVSGRDAEPDPYPINGEPRRGDPEPGGRVEGQNYPPLHGRPGPEADGRVPPVRD